MFNLDKAPIPEKHKTLQIKEDTYKPKKFVVQEYKLFDFDVKKRIPKLQQQAPTPKPQPIKKAGIKDPYKDVKPHNIIHDSNSYAEKELAGIPDNTKILKDLEKKNDSLQRYNMKGVTDTDLMIRNMEREGDGLQSDSFLDTFDNDYEQFRKSYTTKHEDDTLFVKSIVKSVLDDVDNEIDSIEDEKMIKKGKGLEERANRRQEDLEKTKTSEAKEDEDEEEEIARAKRQTPEYKTERLELILATYSNKEDKVDRVLDTKHYTVDRLREIAGYLKISKGGNRKELAIRIVDKIENNQQTKMTRGDSI